MKKKENISLRNRIFWQTFHLPFHIAIIVCGKSVGNILNYMGPKYQPSKSLSIDASLQRSFTTAAALVLLLSSLFVVLHGRVPVFKTRLPFSAILAFRCFTAIIILITGFLSPSLSGLGLISIVAGLLFINLVFSIFVLQNRGDVSLRDTACHIRLGLR